MNLAVAGIVNMPVGSSQFTSTGYDPGVKLAMARTFGNGVSLTTNLQAAAVTDAAGRFTQHAVSLTMSRALSATISGFAEVYRIGQPTRGETGAVSMAAGFARTVGSHMQLDLFAGRGLTDVACNWFVSAGFAVRRSASEAKGLRRGLGVACFLETARGSPNEGAEVRFQPDGRVALLIGTQSNGQGDRKSTRLNSSH